MTIDANNLALWEAVEKTPPSQTKEITGKQYRGNSPKPHWLVRRATEVFGPCGIGWGFVIVDEKMLDGALLADGFYEKVHMARVRVWYEWEGKRGEVEHVGQTLFSGVRKGGSTFTDEDAPKKSVTDALVKALSMIGFAGDIFLGRYDDNKYVSDLRDEEREHVGTNGATKPQEPAKPVTPPIDNCKVAIEKIAAADDSYAVGLILGKALDWQKAGKFDDDEMKRIQAAADKRREQLPPAGETEEMQHLRSG